MEAEVDRRPPAAADDASPDDGGGAKRDLLTLISRRRVALVAAGLSVAAALAGGGLTVANGGKVLQSVPLVFGIAVPYALLGAFLAVKRPGNRMGWVLYAPGAAISLTLLASGYADLAVTDGVEAVAFGHVAGWFAEWSWTLVVPLAAVVLLLFPEGRPPTPRWRWVQTTLLSAIVVLAPLAAIALWPIRGLLPSPPDFSTEELVPPAADALFLVFALVSVIGLIASIVAMAVRFRRADSEVRHQMKWFFTAAGSLIVSMVLLFSGAVPETVAQIVGAVAFLTVPVAIAVAVLRYRLYDIDVVISRSLVFAGLAAFITAIYVGIVVGVGSLLGAGDEPNLALSIMATAVVAVAFQPVRERLTRLANRLVFGKRATPYEVLSTFADHLADAATPESTLERMAKLVADGTGADRVFVWLRVGGKVRPAAVWPEVFLLEPIPARDLDGPAVFVDFDHVHEVVHDGELLGAITLGEPRGEALNHTEQELLTDLAGQAALVMRNLRLTEELRTRIQQLQDSRRRLVRAQDDERRRLERDLHDGAQAQLARLADAVRQAATGAEREGAEKAASLLAQVANDGQDAIRSVRELAHGIYPPVLASEGLTEALAGQLAKAAVPVTIDAEGLGRFGPEVEVAVYFCVLEAVNNAAKYARPSRVTVRLSTSNGHLRFEVTDDGDGFDPAVTPRGHGTNNMADRLDALRGEFDIFSEPGKGTRVRGQVQVTTAREEAPA